MSASTSTGTVDFETVRRAIQGSDGPLLVSLYADDAVYRIIDHSRPPSKPMELQGKAAIAEYLNDVCGRAMTHRVENEVVGENRLSFTEACEYPDGKRVLSAAVLDLRDGKIARQINVLAWDE